MKMLLIKKEMKIIIFGMIKKIEDEIIPQREAAVTKCDPFKDCGKTKANIYNTK